MSFFFFYESCRETCIVLLIFQLENLNTGLRERKERLYNTRSALYVLIGMHTKNVKCRSLVTDPLFSLKRSSSACMKIKTAGDLSTASARRWSGHSA